MIERAYCLICRAEIMTECGQVCRKCAAGAESKDENSRRKRAMTQKSKDMTLAWLCIGGLIAGLTGCATIPTEKHKISYTLVLEDYHALNARYAEMTGDEKAPPLDGFYDPLTATAYVAFSGRRDQNGHPEPVFFALGWETWRSVRLNFRPR